MAIAIKVISVIDFKIVWQPNVLQLPVKYKELITRKAVVFLLKPTEYTNQCYTCKATPFVTI